MSITNWGDYVMGLFQGGALTLAIVANWEARRLEKRYRGKP
jgi:hypothetical protein